MRGVFNIVQFLQVLFFFYFVLLCKTFILECCPLRKRSQAGSYLRSGLNCVRKSSSGSYGDLVKSDVDLANI